MNSYLIMILCATVAFVVVLKVNPQLVLIAYRKKLTDNPNKRKLQKKPIPLLGGLNIFIGVTSSLLLAMLFFEDVQMLMCPILAMAVMLSVGGFDDILSLKPRTRFIFQFLVVSILWNCGYRIDSFFGIFGIYEIGMFFSYLLSVIAGLGLINAINLIDGVDGLSSGIGIITSFICGVYCFLHNDYIFALFAFSFVGALLPFAIYNVFSRKYKMFMGDSGSLVLGTLAYVLVCKVLSLSVEGLYLSDTYVVSFVLAIYSVPVFDTLRVMFARMLKKGSPFKPDKTHLHHCFVEAGYPHVSVTIRIIGINLLVLFIWGITVALQLKLRWQFIIVVITAVLCCWGTYYSMMYFKTKKPEKYAKRAFQTRRRAVRLSYIFYTIRRIIDRY